MAIAMPRAEYEEARRQLVIHDIVDIVDIVESEDSGSDGSSAPVEA